MVGESEGDFGDFFRITVAYDSDLELVNTRQDRNLVATLLRKLGEAKLVSETEWI